MKIDRIKKGKSNQGKYLNTTCQCDGYKTPRSAQCKSCREINYGNMTIGELRNSYERHAALYNSLRCRSRRLAYKNLDKKSCLECGWDEHVEVCHIIPLSSVPDHWTVNDATGPSNFILLCPNHHWKFDHNKEYYNTLAARLGFEPRVIP